MMSFRFVFVFCLLLLPGVTATAADTLHVPADLDTLLTQVVGVMTYRLPDTPKTATFEFQLVPNMYASDTSPYLKSKRMLINIFEQTGEWGGMTVDSAFLDDADITCSIN